jgi:hypothetical protein
MLPTPSGHLRSVLIVPLNTTSTGFFRHVGALYSEMWMFSSKVANVLEQLHSRPLGKEEQMKALKTDGQRGPKHTTSSATGACLLAMLALITCTLTIGHAQQPPPPCIPNPQADQDMATVRQRGDIRQLPGPLRDRLVQLAGRPHSQLPTQTRAEAHTDTGEPKPSRLFQYYLLDTTGFEPNPFTSLIPGVNDTAMLTATGVNCGLPTIGAVRVVLEPKPGLPTDPNNVRAFSDVFTDISGLFVINNETGWY